MKRYMLQTNFCVTFSRNLLQYVIALNCLVSSYRHTASRLIVVYPYQLIERILEFSKHQIADIMSACDPAYRALHKPVETGVFEGG